MCRVGSYNPRHRVDVDREKDKWRGRGDQVGSDPEQEYDAAFPQCSG